MGSRNVAFVAEVFGFVRAEGAAGEFATAEAVTSAAPEEKVHASVNVRAAEVTTSALNIVVISTTFLAEVENFGHKLLALLIAHCRYSCNLPKELRVSLAS